MLPSEPQLRRLLAFLIAGSRGGPMRLRLLDLLAAEPRNAHKLAKALVVDYKTVEHHLRVLGKAGLVAGGDGYGGAYRLSPLLEAHWAVLRAALTQLRPAAKALAPSGAEAAARPAAAASKGRFGETQIKRKEQAKL